MFTKSCSEGSPGSEHWTPDPPEAARTRRPAAGSSPALGHRAAGRVCTARGPGDSPGPARTWGPTSSHRAHIWRSRRSTLAVSMRFTLQIDFKFRLLRRGSWVSRLCGPLLSHPEACNLCGPAQCRRAGGAQQSQGPTGASPATRVHTRQVEGALWCQEVRERGSAGPKQEAGVAWEKDLPGHAGQVMDVPT